MPLLLRWSSSRKLFGILLQGRLVCSPFVTVFSSLLMSGWTHACLFRTLGYNPVSSGFGHWGRFQLALVPRRPHPIRAGIYLFLNTFLLSGTIGCSRVILYISCSKPRIGYFSRELWFLLLGNGIRGRDLGARCARCYWSGPHLFLLGYPDSFIRSIHDTT